MKVIQPFFLGGGIGLVLALGIAAAFFNSPLRKGLYLDWDPEISDLRQRMHAIREQTTAAELAIADAADDTPPFRVSPSGAGSVDSLKRAQAGAWKEYRHWRNRLGELSRLHDRATPAGFAHWVWSMRLVALPAAALLSLGPALLLAWRGARRTHPPRMPTPPKSPMKRAPRDRGTSEALSSFESAVKHVARISAATPGNGPPSPEAGRGAPETPSNAGNSGNAGNSVGRKTEYLPGVPRRTPVTSEAGTPAPPEGEPLPAEPSPYEAPLEPDFREPETDAVPLADSRPARPEGTDTQILQLGPEGWGEDRLAPGAPVPGQPAARETLSMEDEDGAPEIEDPPSGTFMPPTTEVERVERRKAEVLKLARKGLTSSEISRRMRISQDQVEFIIRMRREKG